MLHEGEELLELVLGAAWENLGHELDDEPGVERPPDTQRSRRIAQVSAGVEAQELHPTTVLAHVRVERRDEVEVKGFLSGAHHDRHLRRFERKEGVHCPANPEGNTQHVHLQDLPLAGGSHMIEAHRRSGEREVAHDLVSKMGRDFGGDGGSFATHEGAEEGLAPPRRNVSTRLFRATEAIGRDSDDDQRRKLATESVRIGVELL
mmetsp:Transcript_62249/g.147456  ORF Transcript_62249/g.147456 Transcript_62249/m.147456 type:complete len:205 (+) Transcript_62249:330-944(+)